jgi:trigger factor
MEVTPEKAIRFTLSVEVVPDFELGSYEGLVLKKEEPEGFDAEFEKRMLALREKCATFRAVPRPTQNGDYAVCDYRTFEGDSPVGQPKSNVMLEVGDRLASEEVNAAILGAKPGDERSATVSFPPDYPGREFAGKTITYRFVVRDVKEKQLPEVTEEFAQDLGYESLDALRVDTNEQILGDRKRLTENGLKNQVFDLLTASHDFEPPDSWVQASLARLVRQYELPDDKETREKLLPIATKWARFDCLVARISDKENISISDDEIGAAVESLAESTKSPVEEVARLIDNPMYRNQLLREKVIRFIRDKAKID